MPYIDGQIIAGAMLAAKADAAPRPGILLPSVIAKEQVRTSGPAEAIPYAAVPEEN